MSPVKRRTWNLYWSFINFYTCITGLALRFCSVNFTTIFWYDVNPGKEKPFDCHFKFIISNNSWNFKFYAFLTAQNFILMLALCSDNPRSTWSTPVLHHLNSGPNLTKALPCFWGIWRKQYTKIFQKYLPSKKGFNRWSLTFGFWSYRVFSFDM